MSRAYSSFHVGIDYGSKLAGTTCLCYHDGKKLRIEQSQRKQDADAFLQMRLQELQATHVFIDAPLSLPGVYRGQGDDYFYRQADRELHAMSPLFLGGLLARAMRLKSLLELSGIMVVEVYPAALIKTLGWNMFYKKDIRKFGQQLKKQTGAIHTPLKNWHQVDSVLAWTSGDRFLQGNSIAIGDPGEGIICL
jgi:predicted nuclease with RNAse H fold